jgi:hypothetical protein
VGAAVLLNIAHVGYFVFPPSKLVQSTVNMFIFNERHVTWAFLAVIHMLMLPLTVEALWREGQVRAGGAAPPGAFPVSMPEQAD